MPEGDKITSETMKSLGPKMKSTSVYSASAVESFFTPLGASEEGGLFHGIMHLDLDYETGHSRVSFKVGDQCQEISVDLVLLQDDPYTLVKILGLDKLWHSPLMEHYKRVQTLTDYLLDQSVKELKKANEEKAEMMDEIKELKKTLAEALNEEIQF